MGKVRIREATPGDASGVVPLLTSLGYQVSGDLVSSKLQHLASASDDRVFVAEIDGRLAGVLSFHRIPLFNAPGYAGRITALAVAPDCQRSGVGRASGDHRAGAHSFYQTVGYLPDARRFLKHRPSWPGVPRLRRDGFRQLANPR